MRKSLLVGTILVGLIAGVNSIGGAAARPNVARLVDFLQKSFLIANRDNIHFQKCTPSSLPGMWQCTFKIALGKAEQPIGLLTDAGTHAVVFGSATALKGDLWNRRDLGAVRLADRPTLGDAAAPITIVEFADFQCPFCAKAAAPLEQVVNDHPGEVRLVFKYLPLKNIHPWAERGALAAECARRQKPEAFWTMADAFYQTQRELTADNFDAQLTQIAGQQQLDRDQLGACMNSADAKARIDEDLADAQALKISSTPNVFVQGIHIGSPDADNLEFVVSDQLREANLQSRE